MYQLYYIGTSLYLNRVRFQLIAAGDLRAQKLGHWLRPQAWAGNYATPGLHGQAKMAEASVFFIITKFKGPGPEACELARTVPVISTGNYNLSASDIALLD